MDLLSIGLPNAAEVAARLSHAFADLCRGVEVAATAPNHFDGDADAAYGNRAFLRHYCIHLSGPDRAAGLSPFPAGRRVARGFNGDLDQHLRRWRADLQSGASPTEALGVRVARKTLLAVAGMVSVHEGIWTTNRSIAALQWSEIEPALGPPLALMESWTNGSDRPTRHCVENVLDASGIVPIIVARFNDLIGLWANTQGAP